MRYQTKKHSALFFLLTQTRKQNLTMMTSLNLHRAKMMLALHLRVQIQAPPLFLRTRKQYGKSTILHANFVESGHFILIFEKSNSSPQLYWKKNWEYHGLDPSFLKSRKLFQFFRHTKIYIPRTCANNASFIFCVKWATNNVICGIKKSFSLWIQTVIISEKTY